MSTALETLSQEQKRIRLAEAAGWTLCRPRASIKGTPWISGMNPHPDTLVGIIDAATGAERLPNDSDYGFETLPDYFGSLDAVVALRKLLSDDDAESGSRWRFIDELISIAGAESMEMHREVYRVVDATAEQQSEAIGLALGLWQPGQ